MKKLVLIFIVISLFTSACSENPKNTDYTSENSTTELTASMTAETSEKTGSDASSESIAETTETQKRQAGNTIYKPTSSDDITDIFTDAIPLFTKSLSLDLSAVKLKAGDEKSTVLNAYYTALSEKPSLKYAYLVEIKYDSNTSVAACSIKYMPYKTGEIDINNLPVGTYKINSFGDLINAADKSTGKKNIPIAITNRDLDVETMQKALMQAGYSYIVYSFNNDATALVASPTNGRTMEQCVSYINKTLELADEIAGKIITAGMTPEEKIEAVYKYITSNVKYDQRYYTNAKAMPYESTTAYGAYKDNLAICGGYSWAFKILMNKAEIECCNVSGEASGEYHMWNIARYNNGYFYFDCTFDRGNTEAGYRYFAKTAEDYSRNHIWDGDFISTLVADISAE